MLPLLLLLLPKVTTGGLLHRATAKAAVRRAMAAITAILQRVLQQQPPRYYPPTHALMLHANALVALSSRCAWLPQTVLATALTRCNLGGRVFGPGAQIKYRQCQCQTHVSNHRFQNVTIVRAVTVLSREVKRIECRVSPTIRAPMPYTFMMSATAAHFTAFSSSSASWYSGSHQLSTNAVTFVRCNALHARHVLRQVSSPQCYRASARTRSL